MGKTNKAARRLCTVMTAAAMLLLPSALQIAPSFSADAVDYDAKIAELEERASRIADENKRREEKINALGGDIKLNEALIAELQEQIDGISDEIDTYGLLITVNQEKIAEKEIAIFGIESDIKKKESEISAKREKISALEKENRSNLRRFSQLVRALYMNDPTETLPPLEGSDDWYSFFTYGDVVENISAQNMEFMRRLLGDIHAQEDMIAELDSDIDALGSDKKKLLEKKAKLEGELSDLEEKKREVGAIKEKRYSELQRLLSYTDSLRSSIDELKSDIDASADEVEAINDEIKELIRAKQAESSVKDYSGDGFTWPLDSDLHLITTEFGYDAYFDRNHYGLDIGDAGIGGRNIYAAQSGVVITAYNDGGWHGGFGNYIIIDHGGGLSTLYAHCRSAAVSVGETVTKGDVIGYVGSTGWSTGDHLHFETRVNGTAVNPRNYAYANVGAF